MLVFFFVNTASSRPSARLFRKSLIDMTSHPQSLGAGRTWRALTTRHGGCSESSYVPLCARNLQDCERLSLIESTRIAGTFPFLFRLFLFLLFSFSFFLSFFLSRMLAGGKRGCELRIVASSRSSGLNFRASSRHRRTRVAAIAAEVG